MEAQDLAAGSQVSREPICPFQPRNFGWEYCIQDTLFSYDAKTWLLVELGTTIWGHDGKSSKNKAEEVRSLVTLLCRWIKPCLKPVLPWCSLVVVHK